MWGRAAAARAVSNQWKDLLTRPLVIQELTTESLRFSSLCARFPRLV